MSFAIHFAGDFGQTALSSLQVFERKFLQMPPISKTRPGQNTGNFVPYSLREVHGLTSNQLTSTEKGPTVYKYYFGKLFSVEKSNVEYFIRIFINYSPMSYIFYHYLFNIIVFKGNIIKL